MQTNKFDGRLLRLERMAGAFTLWAGSTVKTLCEVMYGKESTPGTHRLETAIRLHSIPKLLDRPRHLREKLAQFQHVNEGSPISLDRHKRIEEAQQEAEKLRETYGLPEDPAALESRLLTIAQDDGFTLREMRDLRSKLRSSARQRARDRAAAKATAPPDWPWIDS
jgi:hypothetical protein